VYKLAYLLTYFKGKGMGKGKEGEGGEKQPLK